MNMSFWALKTKVKMAHMWCFRASPWPSATLLHESMTTVGTLCSPATARCLSYACDEEREGEYPTLRRRGQPFAAYMLQGLILLHRDVNFEVLHTSISRLHPVHLLVCALNRAYASIVLAIGSPNLGMVCA